MPDAGLGADCARFRQAKARAPQSGKVTSSPVARPNRANRKPISDLQPTVKAELNALSEKLGTRDLKF
jgi:hypothetical protein